MASAKKNNAAAPLPATDPAPSRSPARARPIGRLTIAFTIMLGVLCGVGAFTFGYGKGASYLSGITESSVSTVFPNLSRFQPVNTIPSNLGFLDFAV